VVLSSPRAGGPSLPCATLRSVARRAAPRAVALSYGRTPDAHLAALLAACANLTDAAFALPPEAPPAAGALEGYLAALRAGGELARRHAAGNENETDAAQQALTPPVPLLVLEDDVVLSVIFEDGLRAAAAALHAAGVPRYVLSLYNGQLPPLRLEEAALRAALLRARRRHHCSVLDRVLARCAPRGAPLGAGLLRGGWGWGTQALLFSHAADAAAYFALRVVQFPTHSGGPAYVGLQDMLLREYLYEPQAAAALACGWADDAGASACAAAAGLQAPPAVYGLDASLVQHVGAASTLFGNGTSGAANNRFHQAIDFVEGDDADSAAVAPRRQGGNLPAVEALPWPSARVEAAACAAAALVVPCCAGASGFAEPGVPLRASALPAAVRAAPVSGASTADNTPPLMTFRLTGAPCARAGCCTVSLALRAPRAGAEADAAELARLKCGGDDDGRHLALLPALTELLQRKGAPPPASVLHAPAGSGAAAALLAHVWPAARIVALEPDHNTFIALQRSAYGLGNITTLHAPTQRLLRGAGADPGAAATDVGHTIVELAAAHAPAGFELVWLTLSPDALTLFCKTIGVNSALVAVSGGAQWLDAARAVALELPGGDHHLALLRLLRAVLPRRAWKHAVLGPVKQPLHVFVRRGARYTTAQLGGQHRRTPAREELRSLAKEA
jgi:hypothetical protein